LPAQTDALARRLKRQAGWCLELGSPFYAALLEAAADDLETEGPTAAVLAGFGDEPGTTAVALRLMAAVHRLVLLDALPDLARHYPSTGGDGDAAAAWPLFRQALAEHAARIRALVAGGCQTNEVGRSAALLGGFLEAAERTGLPLRILEIGASAGLNLNWDRYRYVSSTGAWGDPSSPVRFDHAYVVAPRMNRPAEVVERKSCDLNPIDPTTDDGALTLRSFVWADQLARLALLDGAIEVARRLPVEVEKAHAADFLERELARPRDGVATVVYQSVFAQYVDQADWSRIERAVQGPGVFHLAMEPGEGGFEVRLNGELLGTCMAHGSGVQWNVDSTPT
jgi:hypothetical protein